MSLTVSVRTVAAMKLAAVRRQVAIGAWELHGGRRSTRCGISCGQSQACAPTVTTCFSTTTPHAATCRWMWTSELRSARV